MSGVVSQLRAAASSLKVRMVGLYGLLIGDSHLHLDPVPLLMKDDEVKVALPHASTNGDGARLPETIPA